MQLQTGKIVAEDRHIICDKTKRIKKEEIEIGLRKDSSVATDLKKAISRSRKKYKKKNMDEIK
ncbi:MAG: hypothetical protein ACON35_05950 [Candidatus Marinamargulisbacteria bacterium]